MNQNVQYDFCPRCGALMNNGVCQSCEYTIPMNQNLPYQNPAGMGILSVQPPKKHNTGLIVGVIIGGVLLVFLIAAVAIFGISAFIKYSNADTSDEYTPEYDDYDYEDDYNYNFDYEYDFDEDFDFGSIEEPDVWDNIPNVTWDDEETDDGLIDLDGDGIGDLDYDGGKEGLSAEYYPSITDYIRYDLSYSVEFKEFTNSDGTAVCYYPYLTGDKDFISYYNKEFYEIAEETEELADEYDCEVSSISYVTYMDETVLSVVFIDVYSLGEEMYYEDIYCYSFDMTNGDVLEFVLTDTSDEFLDDLKERCLEQSTADAAYLFDEYSNDELRDIFANYDHSIVAFYSPLGMEIGITYEGYWCCATYKDYKNYIGIAQEESSEF